MTRWLALLTAVACAGSAAASSPASAAEKRCGSLGTVAADYRDIRAEATSCRSAKGLVRAYIREFDSCGNVLNRCDVGRYVCRGRRSDRQIERRETFRVNCRRGEARVRWWITVFH
jgi:hypothetical protein